MSQEWFAWTAAAKVHEILLTTKQLRKNVDFLLDWLLDWLGWLREPPSSLRS